VATPSEALTDRNSRVVPIRQTFEVAKRYIGRLAVQRRDDRGRADVGELDQVAIGRRLGDHQHADDPSDTRAVVHDHRLPAHPRAGRHPFRSDARDAVREPTDHTRGHQADRA